MLKVEKKVEYTSVTIFLKKKKIGKIYNLEINTFSLKTITYLSKKKKKFTIYIRVYFLMGSNVTLVALST